MWELFEPPARNKKMNEEDQRNANLLGELNGVIRKYAQQGIPMSAIRKGLLKAGWPIELVKYSTDSYERAHSKLKTKKKATKTDFDTWLTKYQKRAIPAVSVVVVLNIIGAAIMLLKPWPTKILADSVFGNVPAPSFLEPYTGTSTLILWTSGMTLLLFILGALFGTVRDYFLLKIGFWLNKGVKQESFRHILHLPMYHKGRLAKGDYVYRQNVVTNSLSDLVLGTTSSIIQSIIMIIGVLVIMLLFSVQLTLITVVLIPLLFVTMRVIGPKLGGYAQSLTENSSETAALINESIDNTETVQSFTLETKLLDKVVALWDRGYKLRNKLLLWGDLLTNTNGLLIVISTAAVMYFGGVAALEGTMTLGKLLIFMTYMSYLLGPVENLIEQVTSRNQKKIDVNRIYEVMTDHEGVEDLRSDHPMPAGIKGNIELRNITYSYGDTPIFENLNMTIPAGQKIGIIGPSGGGKSTILKLIPLFIEPDSGSVLIDNIDTQTVSLKSLRRNISWVAQTPQLFTDTILGNIRDGDTEREITQEEIREAVVVSNVAEFVTQMPLALATPAGENGGSLSGGQRQRVSIARALVKNSSIICLDEPTAALDAKSENYIKDSLQQMIQGKTVLMVTHRKALLALMDTVFVLDKGTLTDVDELGGLSHYLAQLEGIEDANAEQSIQAEKASQDTQDNLVDDALARSHTIINAESENNTPPPQSAPEQEPSTLSPHTIVDPNYAPGAMSEAAQPAPIPPQGSVDNKSQEDSDDEIVVDLHKE